MLDPDVSIRAHLRTTVLDHYHRLCVAKWKYNSGNLVSMQMRRYAISQRVEFCITFAFTFDCLITDNEKVITVATNE